MRRAIDTARSLTMSLLLPMRGDNALQQIRTLRLEGSKMFEGTSIGAGGRVQFAIVLPVYNDWVSFNRLLLDIQALFPRETFDIVIYAIDDCSDTLAQPLALNGPIAAVNIVRLSMNVGHQRAIAVGLVLAAERPSADWIAVMDADGEDRPEDLRTLVTMAADAPDKVFVALRKKRSEGVSFKLFYWLYVRAFKMLTGKSIRFGNFSVLPRRYAVRLAHNGNVWNHFAATLVQAKMPLEAIPTIRGTRYAGRSSMNFVSLVTHGLGAMSVFSEAIFVRIILMSGLLLGASLIGSLTVIAMRLFTSVTVPGWATSVLGFAALLSVQAIVTPILMAFMLLNNRSALQIVPKDTVLNLVESVIPIYEREAAEVPEQR